ncbi:hypothetical protein MJT46_009948 [Ovis ammon polii x Ovis aries]|nr:hypothetical protein MJT46_009948 [Ovis ammon polii x Ovis aries]
MGASSVGNCYPNFTEEELRLGEDPNNVPGILQVVEDTKKICAGTILWPPGSQGDWKREWEFLEVPSGISGDTHTLLPDPHLSAVKQRNLRNHLINENLTQKVSCTLSLKHFPSHPQGKTVHSKCGHCGHHTPWLPPGAVISVGRPCPTLINCG